MSSLRAVANQQSSPIVDRYRVAAHVSLQNQATFRSLDRYGYEVSILESQDQARGALEEFSVFCLELSATEINSIDTIREICAKFEDVPVIIIGDQAHSARAIDIVRVGGAYWYLAPPFQEQDLAMIIAKACIHREMTRENKTLKASLSPTNLAVPLLGKSRAMVELRAQIQAIASLDSTVLLTGESGTGKTSVARAIHQLSPRSESPLVSINCASIPRELLEAELFGYERGAFTGAVRTRIGSIEAASGGTLFLDEIGDLPLDLQPKLLSFLQDRSVRKLGSSKEQTVDVRVIAATNRDLSDLRKRGLFRDDLFYRVNVLSIQVPPLRARREDIRLIAEARLEYLAPRLKRKNLRLSNEALDALADYDWPGNVRELENILERAAAFSQSGSITRSDLGLPESESLPSPRSTLHHETKNSLDLEDLERITIQHALDRAQGRKPEAARLLGISLKSIYNKMRKYGLD